MSIDIPSWVPDAIFYQIFPDRFAKSDAVTKPKHLQPWGDEPTSHSFQGGDLLGVVEKLDYLVELGINAIYFNPIFASASNHRYHTFDYYQIDPLLGGNEAFQTLLKAAHQRGIRVILDGVFNHTSRGFFQFNHLLECGEESPYRDWFHVYQWPIHAYDESKKADYAAWWGLHALPKLNTDNEQVREFLFNVATYWLEQGIDGWRLDVPGDIDDDEFWREFRRRCRAVNPQAYIVGELWDDAHRWLQGDQFDAQMNYGFARAALGFFAAGRINQAEAERSGLGHIMERDGASFLHELHRLNNQMYASEIVLAQMNMLGSHDTPRTLTLVDDDVAITSQMWLCMMLMPGAPNIYYGDEIGMLGKHDPENRRAFPWHDPSSWENELLADMKRFIALRKRLPALRRGDFRALWSNADVVVFARVLDEQVVLVAFNRSENAAQVTLPVFDWLPQKMMGVLGNDEMFSAETSFTIPAHATRIWATP